ncbi:NlpC/P60 family protein [compost metagenome]
MEVFDNENVREDIRRHAAKEYPRECCGVVVSIEGSPQYFPCKNISEDPTEEFQMSPEDMTDAMDLGELEAIVHSHPDATSQPSTFDLAFMERYYALELALDPEAKPTPWIILSWPEGDFRQVVAQGGVPLTGREFVHGLHDCWQCCADYYFRSSGLTFPNFERQDGWWEDKDGPSHYEQNFLDCGFYKVPLDEIQVGDLIVMQIGRTYHPNHAAIYLGNVPKLPDEELDIFGQGPFILHHMYARKSAVEIYGGQWLHRTSFVLRHKDYVGETS